MYKYNEKPVTALTTDANGIIQEILRSTLETAVLVGRNNCGKSFLLKFLTQMSSGHGTYLGPARYQNFMLLGAYDPTSDTRSQRYQQFMNLWSQPQNHDSAPINLQQAIAELKDSERQKLFEIVKLLLGANLEVRQTIDGNMMSQKYISCDGHNISYTSSGLRLVITLITCLLDTNYPTVLIDEPELGISPEAQGILADFLFNKQLRSKYFPHIKKLIFATHSTIFLDRTNISNNFMVEKKGDLISINKINNQSEFSRIHFLLLGNRFETLYLPALIVLVEGKSDYKFIEKIANLKFPNSQLSLIHANSDGRIKEIVNLTKGILTDIQKSPYKDRIFVVLDSVHSFGLSEELVAMGIDADNIIKWPKNGIEYFYPPSVMDEIYGSGGEIVLAEDRVSRNGISYTKNELVEKVILKTQSTTALHPILEDQLLSKMRRKL